MEGLYHVGACVADGKKDFVFLAALGEVRRGGHSTYGSRTEFVRHVMSFEQLTSALARGHLAPTKPEELKYSPKASSTSNHGWYLKSGEGVRREATMP